MKDFEFKQFMLHYYRTSFEKIGIQKRLIKDINKSDIYSEEEWNKMSKVTGIEKNKLRRWRSEYDRFKNAFETLQELANVGQYNSLIDFITTFFRLNNTIKYDNNLKQAHWSTKVVEHMKILNEEDFENRIKLNSFILFICTLNDPEIREEILDISIVISNKLRNCENKNKILSIINLFKNAIK